MSGMDVLKPSASVLSTQTAIFSILSFLQQWKDLQRIIKH